MAYLAVAAAFLISIDDPAGMAWLGRRMPSYWALLWLPLLIITIAYLAFVWARQTTRDRRERRQLERR
jgi:hypothetical protein